MRRKNYPVIDPEDPLTTTGREKELPTASLRVVFPP